MPICVLIHRNEHEMFDDPPHELFNKCNQVKEAIESIHTFVGNSVKDGRRNREMYTGTFTRIRPRKKRTNKHRDRDRDRDGGAGSGRGRDRDRDRTSDRDRDRDTDTHNRDNFSHSESNDNHNNKNTNSGLARSNQYTSRVPRNIIDSLDYFRFHANNKTPPLNNASNNNPFSNYNNIPNASNNNPFYNNNNNNNPNASNNRLNQHFNYRTNPRLSTLPQTNTKPYIDDVENDTMSMGSLPSDSNEKTPSKAKKKKKTQSKAKKKRKKKTGVDSDDEYRCPAYDKEKNTKRSPRPQRVNRNKKNYAESDDGESVLKIKTYEEKIDEAMVCLNVFLFLYVCVIM